MAYVASTFLLKALIILFHDFWWFMLPHDSSNKLNCRIQFLLCRETRFVPANILVLLQILDFNFGSQNVSVRPVMLIYLLLRCSQLYLKHDRLLSSTMQHLSFEKTLNMP